MYAEYQLSNRTQHPKLPSREGPRGVSRLRIASQTKNIHPKPTNRTSKNSSKNIPTAPLTITLPLLPSQKTNYQTKSSIQNSPLERGRGCVTPKHCHLKPKTSTRSRQIPPPREPSIPDIKRTPKQKTPFTGKFSRPLPHSNKIFSIFVSTMMTLCTIQNII